MKSLGEAFSHVNKVLLLLGAAGFAIYLIILPMLHPDALPDYELDSTEILTRAQSFAENQGYSISDYNWSTDPTREDRLLDSLQAHARDQRVYDIVDNPQNSQLPLYSWRVRGVHRDEEGEESGFMMFKLTLRGEVWDFDVRNLDPPAPVREALLQTRFFSSKTATALDSINTEDMVGVFWSVDRRRPPGPPPTTRRNDSLSAVIFNTEDAEAIAGYYLAQTSRLQYNLEVDSIFRSEGPDRSIVSVSYSGQDQESSIPIHTVAQISTSGVLHSLKTDFNPLPQEDPGPGSEINLNFGAGTIAGSLRFIVILGLVLFTLILFLRRLNARLIDVKGAMQDAIWGGLFATIATGNSAGWRIFLEHSSPWVGLLLALALVLAAGSAGAFLVFIVSCATDSIARAVWPTRLTTLTFARNARFINMPMGNALVHSVGLAGIFLGLTTLFLLYPGLSWINLGEEFPGANALSGIMDLISVNGFFSMLTCMVVLLSVGATFYSKTSRYWVIMGIVALVAAILYMGPLKVTPYPLQWVLSGISGALLIAMLFRFDYFTCFVGYMLYAILWNGAPLWISHLPDFTIDASMVLVLPPLIFIVGLIGLVSGKTVDDDSQFIPEYLREVAQQERMRGELEIARQVQASLLPRRMPTFEDMDIAAMCLPAQEVGGDYFDFIRLDENRLALVIGDVSGKGIQAGFFMTLTKGFLHAVCRKITSPAEVLTEVNQLFCKNVPRGTFISLIYGIIDVADHTFTFARAGHDPVLYCSAKLDAPAFHKPRGMAIGLTPTKTFEESIQDEVIQLGPNDLLVFYTDGVTEAVNPSSEQFGADRLAQKVELVGMKKTARQVLQEVSEHIQAFVKSAGRADDMTMVVVRVAPRQQPLTTDQTPETQSWLEHEL